MVVMGYNIAPVGINRMGGSVLIGTNMMVNQNPVQNAPVSGAVIIGANAVERHTMVSGDGGLFQRVVLIGWRVARGKVFGGPNSGCSLQTSVIIGDDAAVDCGSDGPGNGNGISDAVIIGSRSVPQIAGLAGQSSGGDILIGAGVGQNYRAGSNNVAVGAQIVMGTTGQIFNLIVGAGSQGTFAVGGSFNTLLGSQISGLNLLTNNVVIGSGAIPTANPILSKQLLIEIQDRGSGLQESLLYGDFGKGALLVGKSVPGNRDLPGTNLLKFIDGVPTGVAPIGGGFAYSVGGELHWFSSAGTNYAITPSASLGNVLVAALPAAPPAGSRAFATDALAPAFGAAVVGGGGVFVPVFFNGAAWIVG
jgi:hypothetical protein